MASSVIRIDLLKDIDYDTAIASEHDIVFKHHQYLAKMDFAVDLWYRRQELVRLVAEFVRVDVARIQVGHPGTWRHGGFNIAIPMLIFENAGDAHDQADLPRGPDSSLSLSRVILRVPVPSKCGEEPHPGSIEEKIRCEMAMYVWMQRNAPQVRIPHLYGFGLPNAIHVRLSDWAGRDRSRLLAGCRLCVSFLTRSAIPVPYAVLTH